MFAEAQFAFENMFDAGCVHGELDAESDAGRQHHAKVGS